jgi:hypothetical protein
VISAGWNAFWFAPAPARGLALARIAFFGLLALLYAPYDFRGWADVAPVFWSPVWAFAELGLRPASAPVLAVLQALWKLALVGACLGVATRASLWLSFGLGFYLLGLPHNFGKIHHYDAILVFTFLIMACARCGDALTLDRWARRALTGRPPAVAAPSGEYTWPVRLVWLLLALVFLGAGVSKLRTSGLAWIWSDTLAIFLVQHQYRYGNAVPLTSLGLALAQHAWLCRLLAAGTVACELGYPLTLVSRWARRLLVPGALLLQLGIRIFLGPTFFDFMVCNVFWVPWDRLASRMRAQPPAARRAAA